MTVVYTLSYLDQNLMLLLVQPIKDDLHLSDTQIGFLTGIAFGLFYAILGLPIGRWADHSNRTTISSIAIGLWGATVMASLFVTSFVQLVLARVAAAVGGSGCMPPTYSLLGDYFPAAAARARAMTIYMMASAIAILVSFMVGGWLNELYGWRIAFFAMGVPGLIAAVVIKLTIKEPRAHTRRTAIPPGHLPRIVDVLVIVSRQRSSRHLVLALMALYVLMCGMGPWYAAFMIRSHAMGTAELGTLLGLIFGVAGIAGTLLGGYVATHWFAEDERGQMRLTAVVTASLVPCFALFLLLPGKWQSLAGLMPLIVVLNFFLGPTFALMQRLVAADMRATAVAVVMLLVNLVGMGIGPQAVGLLSDWLKPHVAGDSLRYAMLLLSSLALWAAYHFWQVGETVRGDLSVAHAAPPC
jgi:predicted MFS family arabinose efflux permease